MRVYPVVNEHVSLVCNTKMVQGATLKIPPKTSRVGFFPKNLYNSPKNPRKPKKLTKEVIGLGIFCCSIDLLRQLRLCAVPSVHHIITRV